jgi:hypothetical protein
VLYLPSAPFAGFGKSFLPLFILYYILKTFEGVHQKK